MRMAILVAGKNFARLPWIMKAFKESLDKRITGLLALIGEQVVGESRDSYLSGPRPKHLGRINGDLARSVFYQVANSSKVFKLGTPTLSGDPSSSFVAVGSNLKYAPVHEFGATIRAKNAPFLVFKTLDGAWHKIKKVVIPARPFLQPAVQDSREVIRKLAGQTFMQAYREATSGV